MQDFYLYWSIFIQAIVYFSVNITVLLLVHAFKDFKKIACCLRMQPMNAVYLKPNTEFTLGLRRK